MIFNFIIQLLIGLALMVVGYLLMPKPKQQKPPAVKDMENPVAEAGKPIIVIFGTVLVKGLNNLWFGDKSYVEYNVSS